MKIVIDSGIPFIKGVFEQYADVCYIPGREITNGDLLDADALVVRTRTKCDEALLEGTAVKIIATATIGTDHIDFDFCKKAGIHVQNASGSNAGGVMNYVFSALYGSASRRAIRLDNMVIGIIGVGNVGRRVEEMATYLGFNVLKCDPPRAEAEGSYGFVTMDELLRESNIVTMHVPLNDSTRRMCDYDFFAKMQPGAFFINAARGEIVDDDALIYSIPKLGPVIIDTWNNEPHVNLHLVEKVDIATPHIAGYSYQGKQNATAAVVRAVARYFSISGLFDYFPETDPDSGPIKLDLKRMSQGQVTSAFQYNYPIFTDDFLFRLNPSNFEKLRLEYSYRREFFIE